MKAVCIEMQDDLGKIFELMDKSIQTKLWRFVWETFSTNYLLLVVSASKVYHPRNLQEFIAKLAKDVDLVKMCFSTVVKGRHFDEHCKKVETILMIYSCEEDFMVSHLLNLELLMSEEFDKGMLKQILRLRSDVKKSTKKQLEEMLDQVENIDRSKKRRSTMKQLQTKR